MPTTSHPLKVFLCHAHADKSAVRNLYRHLKERKIDVWLDAEKLLPGQNWQVEIPKALLSSDVIIICLSKNSVDKEGYVQKEIKFALDKALEMPEGRIFLIPARLEECDLPHSLSAFHFVNLFEEDGYKRLLRSLRARAEQIGAMKVGQIANTSDHEEFPEPVKSNPTYENAKRETAEKAEREKLEREKAELAKLEQEAKEKARREAAEKAEREKLELEKEMQEAQKNTKQEAAPEPKKQEGRNLSLWGIGIITFAILALVIWGLSSIMPTPSLGIGSTMIGKGGANLVYIPAGEFKMGIDNGESDEKPVHTVYLDAFWIDQTEVTNKQYQACVDASMCEPPSSIESNMHPNYYENPEFDNYPVIYVNWDKANRYCEVWAGGDLPTEAQWEKAARGTDERIYPWGNDAPNKDLLNYNASVGDTTKVGSYETGKSFYGAYDMAGNVWEWINDWYGETYYQSLSSSNPLGPDAGQYRILRGGAWDNTVVHVGSAHRYSDFPSSSYNYIGFRCARSP